MRYFYLYIFLLICFIIGVSYYNTIQYKLNEGFKPTSQKTYILIGDSILKNNAYTMNGKGIDDLLLERTNGNSYCYAQDHSKIVDIYSQISQIPLELNNKNTTIFVSAGGNDLLTYYVDQENNTTNTDTLKPMFSAYKKLIKSIKTKMTNANIVLLDIYYPKNLTYQQYRHIIQEWNQKIYSYGSDRKNNIHNVFKVSNILTDENDFSFGIEPSTSGGEKIVENIVSYY
jgi:hypothetical protein